jgi:hypothetical protein
MLSAFRRSCLSVNPLLNPTVLEPLDIGPACPLAFNIDDKARASVAADSMALKMSGLTRFFVLERAERSKGCVSRCCAALLLVSACAMLAPDPRFGDADMVVAFVMAVGGRSSVVLYVDPPDAGAIFPVSSSL